MLQLDHTRGVNPGWHPSRRWRYNVAVFARQEAPQKQKREAMIRLPILYFLFG